MDITKCKGENCPNKEICLRFTSKSNELRQWFTEPPFKIEYGKFSCDLFWNETQTNIIDQLEEIMKVK